MCFSLCGFPSKLPISRAQLIPKPPSLSYPLALLPPPSPPIPPKYSPKKPNSEAPPSKTPRGANASLLDDIKSNMEQNKAEDLAGKSLFNPEGTMVTQSNQLAARVDYVCEQQIHYTKKVRGCFVCEGGGICC